MAAEPVGTALLFANNRVRVWEMVLVPGQTCQPHRHEHDYLMLYTTPATVRATLDDGRPVIQHVDPGMAAYRVVGSEGRAPHAITNTGQQASHHFVIELLGPSAAATARPVEHNGRGRIEQPSGDASDARQAPGTR